MISRVSGTAWRNIRGTTISPARLMIPTRSPTDRREALIELTGKVEPRRDHDLAAMIDVAVASFDADRRHAFAERHRTLETRGNDLLPGLPVDIAAQSELAVALHDRVRHVRLLRRCRARRQ